MLSDATYSAGAAVSTVISFRRTTIVGEHVRNRIQCFKPIWNRIDEEATRDETGIEITKVKINVNVCEILSFLIKIDRNALANTN